MEESNSMFKIGMMLIILSFLSLFFVAGFFSTQPAAFDIKYFIDFSLMSPVKVIVYIQVLLLFFSYVFGVLASITSDERRAGYPIFFMANIGTTAFLIFGAIYFFLIANTK